MVTGRMLRRVLAVLVVAAGGGLLAFGVWQRQPEAGLAGLGLWLALAIGLAVVLRQRANVAMQLGAATRFEVGQVLEQVGKLAPVLAALDARHARSAEAQATAQRLADAFAAQSNRRVIQQLDVALRRSNEMLRVQARFASDLEALARDLAAHEQRQQRTQDTLRQFVIEGNELALNGYRQLALDLDAHRSDRASATRSLLGAWVEARARVDALESHFLASQEQVVQGFGEVIGTAMAGADEVLAQRLLALQQALDAPLREVAGQTSAETVAAQLHAAGEEVGDRLAAEIVLSREEARSRLDELGAQVDRALVAAHGQMADAIREVVGTAMAGADEQLARRLRGVQRAILEPLQAIADQVRAEAMAALLEGSSEQVVSRLSAEIVRNRKETRDHFADLETERAGLRDALAELANLQKTGVEQGQEQAKGIRHAIRAATAVSETLENNRLALEREMKLIQAGQQEGKRTLETLTNENRARIFAKKTLRWIKTDTVVDVAALLELPRLLAPRAAMPNQTSYAMEPSSILALVEQILKRKPLHVVECGSGMSSLWMGYALEKAGQGRLVSLEHHDYYAQVTREQVAAHRLQKFVDVRHAPLSTYSLDGTDYGWYGKAAVGRLRKGIDMLLVDGPPESTGPMARYPAFPVLAGKLADGAVVILDDADRPDEKKIVGAWREHLPGLGEPIKIGSRTVMMEYRAG